MLADAQNRVFEAALDGSTRALGSGTRAPVPGADYRIAQGDTLRLMGLHDAVEKFLAERQE